MKNVTQTIQKSIDSLVKKVKNLSSGKTYPVYYIGDIGGNTYSIKTYGIYMIAGNVNLPDPALNIGKVIILTPPTTTTTVINFVGSYVPTNIFAGSGTTYILSSTGTKWTGGQLS